MKTGTAKKFCLYLLSDSSGNLLEHFFAALLTQFPRESFCVETLAFMTNADKLAEAFKRIRAGIIFHAVVSPKLKKQIEEECRRRKLACWDVTGPTAQFLEKTTGAFQSREPAPLHSVNSGYMNRMRALEFTLQHDDSRRIEDLPKADIVLVGLSRVSKSPTALFLAYRGFLAANVSIVPEQGLPEPLQNPKLKNVVALTLQPKRLSEIRTRRFSQWDLKEFDYTDLPNIIREVMAVEKIYKKKGWPVIDTTHLAVEEISTLCLSALHLKPRVLVGVRP